MAKRFQLTCLGLPELRTADGKVVRIRVKKHLALLVYLAIERRGSHSRARLVELFWSGVQPKRGRHSCATALSVLRNIFGKTAFATARDVVRFHPADLALDLDILQKGEVVGPDGEAVIDVDGFLRGFELDDCPEWDLWKEREHSNRMPAIHAGLLTLIDHGRRRGSHEEIMQRAERLLALDHLAEEAVRAKMEALALVGDRFSALRVFDEWKELLASELRAEPSGLVEGMASQLRKRGWEPKEPNPIPAVPAEQWRDRKFVGRRAEYRVLYETWEAVHQFEPRYFLIAGDSGVGKTTLAQRLVTAAGMEGASVSRVQCYQMEQRIPFAMIGGLVTGLLGRPGLAATAPEALAEIARLVPGVKAHFPNLPQPKQGEGESARLLFAEGVLDLLTAVMEERPLLLVVDDIHNADEASLAVLHLVMRRLKEGRLLTVSTTRPIGYPTAHPGPSFPVFRQPRHDGVTLDPFSDEESHELLLDLVRGGPPPLLPERRALVQASRGFPMALEFLVYDWKTNGNRCLGLALRAMTRELTEAQQSPGDPHIQLVQRLFADLPAPSKQVLLLAAVLGQGLDNLTAYSIVDLNLGQAIQGLSDLTERRVLRDLGNGLEFINEVIRAQIYLRMTAAVRAELHSAIADAALSGRLVHSDFALAWHLMRARRPEDAAPPLLRGSQKALLSGAPHEAILSLASSLADLPAQAYTPAATILVEAYNEIGAWQQAIDIATSIPPASRPPLVDVLLIEARWRLGAVGHAELLAIAEQLLGLSRRRVEAVPKALLLATQIAGSQLDEPLLRKIQVEWEQVETQGPREVALVHTAAAMSSYYCRDLSGAQRHAQLALEVVRSIGAADASVVNLTIGLAVVHAAQANYDEARERAKEAILDAKRLGNDLLEIQASGTAALACLRLGLYGEVISIAAAVEGRKELFQLPSAQVNAANLYYSLCCALISIGRKEAAIEALASSIIADPERGQSSWFQQVLVLFKADIYWLAGQRARAIRIADGAVSGPDHQALSRGIAGAFIRWTAVTGSGQPEDFTQLRLLQAFERRWELDSVDRLEVLLAVSLRMRLCDPAIAARAESEAALAAADLPQATVAFIEELFGYRLDRRATYG